MPMRLRRAGASKLFASSMSKSSRFFFLAVRNPKNFFRSSDFTGPLKTSFLVIAAAVAIAAFLASWTNPFIAIVMAPAGALIGCISAAALAGIFTLVRRFTHAQGDFSRYLRFFAVTAIAYLPIALIAGIPALAIPGALLGLAFFGWWVYGYFVAFEAKLIPTIVAHICIVASFVFLNFALMASVSFLPHHKRDERRAKRETPAVAAAPPADAGAVAMAFSRVDT